MELIGRYDSLNQAQREILSFAFDKPDNCYTNLAKVHSFIDYMSKTYQETHTREPSIDLIVRFKLDLEKAKTAPAVVVASPSDATVASASEVPEYRSSVTSFTSEREGRSTVV